MNKNYWRFEGSALEMGNLGRDFTWNLWYPIVCPLKMSFFPRVTGLYCLKVSCNKANHSTCCKGIE